MFAEQIVAALPAGEEQDYLTALLSRGRQRPDPPDTLSPLGAMVQSLLAGEAVDGDALLAALPEETRAAFARLSPATTVASLEAPMYVMHDVGDHLVPYTESRDLVNNLPPEVLQRYAEFHMFEHVYPRDPTQITRSAPRASRAVRAPLRGLLRADRLTTDGEESSTRRGPAADRRAARMERWSVWSPSQRRSSSTLPRWKPLWA